MRWTGILVGLSTLLAACGGESEEVQTINLGLVVDRTGGFAFARGETILSLAVRDMNDGLAKAGRKVKFEVLSSDSQSEPTVAVQRATDLVKNQKVNALVLINNSASTVALNALNYASDASQALSVPMVCATCASSNLNDPAATHADPATQEALRNQKGWLFRTNDDSTPVGVIMTRIGLAAGNNGDVNGDGKFKMTIYSAVSPVTESVALGAEKSARRLHGGSPVLERVTYPANADANSYNWAADVAKLVDGKNEVTGADDGVPDLIAAAILPQHEVGFTKSYLQGGHSVRLLHSWLFITGPAVQSLGNQANNQEGAAFSIADGPSGEIVAAEILEATGGPIVANDSLYYDAASLTMLGVLRAAGSADITAITPDQVRVGLTKINEPTGEIVRPGKDGFARAAQLILEEKPINYDGVSGPCDWDQTQRAKQRFIHFGVEQLKIIQRGKYDCASSEDCPPVPM